MKFLALVIVTGLLLTGCSGSSGSTTTSVEVEISDISSTTTPETGRDAGWVSDLRLLEERLVLLHPNPFWKISESEWTAELNGLIERVPQLSDEEMRLEIVGLLAQIDGQTGLAINNAEFGLHRYQIRLYSFADGVFVVESEDPDLVGGRVISVSGTAIHDALEAVSVYVSNDNDQTVAAFAPSFVVTQEFLTAVNILDNPTQPAFEIVTRAGETIVYDPPLLSAALWNQWVEFFAALPGRPGTLAGERVADAFWWTYLEDSEAVYIQYNLALGRSSDATSDAPLGIQDLVDEVAAATDGQSVHRVIVDVRRNPGGSVASFRTLVPMLTQWSSSTDQPLVVLTSRHTFSAGATFAATLERDTNAVFIGEATGAIPNVYGNITTLTLPYSGLVAAIPTQLFNVTGADDDRMAIEPDLAVPINSFEFFADQDPVLDAALNYSEQGS